MTVALVTLIDVPISLIDRSVAVELVPLLVLPLSLILILDLVVEAHVLMW
jgi:hypothetical protein